MSTVDAPLSFACPACGRQGRSARPIPPGTKVRCRCGHSFRVGDAGSQDLPLPEVEPEPEAEPGFPLGIDTSDDFDPDPDAKPADAPAIAVAVPVQPLTAGVAGRRGDPDRVPEPFYFRVMEFVGWCDVVLGTLQMAGMVLFGLGILGTTIRHAPPGEGLSRAAGVAAVVVLPPLGVSLGILVTCLVSGYFLWITVDIARSLRYANTLRVRLGA